MENKDCHPAQASSSEEPKQEDAAMESLPEGSLEK